MLKLENVEIRPGFGRFKSVKADKLEWKVKMILFFWSKKFSILDTNGKDLEKTSRTQKSSLSKIADNSSSRVARPICSVFHEDLKLNILTFRLMILNEVNSKLVFLNQRRNVLFQIVTLSKFYCYIAFIESLAFNNLGKGRDITFCE
jgi:hypothetical protein